MLNTVCTADFVMLYWDLPESFVAGNQYAVRMDGKIIGRTHKCHYKVNDLSPYSTYKFEVSMEGTTECNVGRVSITTEPVKKRIDITKPPYNAVGDGKTLNTSSIQAAIDDCKPGECVYVPSGDYMTGSLFLHSDMELYLDKNAIIHGTTEVKDYSPKIASRFEGYERMSYAGLINIGTLDRTAGYTCSNVRIMGEGTICGGGWELGQNVIDVEYEHLKAIGDPSLKNPEEYEIWWTVPGRARPRLINVSCAQNVTVMGITIMNGCSWNMHMIYSDNVVTCACTIRSKGVYNGDGWDPDSSTNCTLFGCEFFTQDDSVAIKSGKNPEGNIINRPCKHIRIFDCVSHYGHGVCIGSEMSGGVEDVRIWNCDLGSSYFGVEIKATAKRGGYVRDVRVRNCRVCSILMHQVGYNDDGEAAPDMPVFENCSFENVIVTGCRRNKEDEDEYCEAIELRGFDSPSHYIRNVRFKNILIDSGKESRRQNIYLQYCDDITMENVRCR